MIYVVFTIFFGAVMVVIVWPTVGHYEITASHYEITASHYEFKNGHHYGAIMDRIKMAYISNNK
jgi:hypothetical protein